MANVEIKLNFNSTSRYGDFSLSCDSPLVEIKPNKKEFEIFNKTFKPTITYNNNFSKTGSFTKSIRIDANSGSVSGDTSCCTYSKGSYTEDNGYRLIVNWSKKPIPDLGDLDYHTYYSSTKTSITYKAKNGNKMTFSVMFNEENGSWSINKGYKSGNNIYYESYYRGNLRQTLIGSVDVMSLKKTKYYFTSVSWYYSPTNYAYDKTEQCYPYSDFSNNTDKSKTYSSQKYDGLDFSHSTHNTTSWNYTPEDFGFKFTDKNGNTTEIKNIIEEQEKNSLKLVVPEIKFIDKNGNEKLVNKFIKY